MMEDRITCLCETELPGLFQKAARISVFEVRRILKEINSGVSFTMLKKI